VKATPPPIAITYDDKGVPSVTVGGVAWAPREVPSEHLTVRDPKSMPACCNCFWWHKEGAPSPVGKCLRGAGTKIAVLTPARQAHTLFDDACLRWQRKVVGK